MPSGYDYDRKKARIGSASDKAGNKSLSSRERSRKPDPILQDLVPIAVVIGCGCEPCAEAAVMRALKQGSSPRHVQELLRIVSCMCTLDCLIRSVGSDRMVRMEKALSAATKTIQKAASNSE